jgi:hypothetical protein
MKKILLFFFLICLFLIQGCGAANGKWVINKIDHNAPIVKQTSKAYIKNYTIGENKSAFIGQEIIRVKEHYVDLGEFVNSFIAPRDIVIDISYIPQNYLLRIEANKQYETDGKLLINGETYYVIAITDKDNMKWGVLVSKEGTIYSQAIYHYYYGMLFFPRKITFIPDSSNIKLSAQKEIKTIRDIPGIMYELIYSGKNDISLNTTYKEYTENDLARPAFFQNLTYQTNAKQIRFKDFVIQIHNVTNERINYTVIEDILK